MIEVYFHWIHFMFESFSKYHEISLRKHRSVKILQHYSFFSTGVRKPKLYQCDWYYQVMIFCIMSYDLCHFFVISYRFISYEFSFHF